MYRYHCTVTRIIDGDTIDADVDLGFRITQSMRFRLLGIDAGDKATKAADKAHLDKLIAEGSPITIESHKTEKFGRWLAVLYDKDGKSINQAMVEAGHAKPYDGQGPRT